MYIANNKHFTIMTGEPAMEYPPKLYMDFFTLKANLKRSWKDHSTFQFHFGLLGFHFTFMFYWDFVERKRSEIEEKEHARLVDFMNSMKKEGE